MNQRAFFTRPDPDGHAMKLPAHPTDTQVEAADRAQPTAGTARRRVLDLIRFYGEVGATDEQIAKALGMNPNTERPRRKELEEMGWIRDSGERRKTASGSPAIVWTFSPEVR